MRCYYHQDREAVGSCKSCNKGLCPYCLVDLGKGMACKGRCEEDVRGLIAVNEVNVAISGRIPGQLRANRLMYLWMGWFFLAMGFLAIVFGAFIEPPVNFLTLSGGGLVIFGLLSLFVVSRMPRFQEGQASEGRPNSTAT